MALLSPAPVSTDRFHYTAATNTFTAEASDLNGLGRVWDDACDLGLTLVSAKTGRAVVFAQTHSERDSEGELLWDEYRPAKKSEWGAGTVRVYND